MKEKITQVRFRGIGTGGLGYYIKPFNGCLYIDEGVTIEWIDVRDDELVITTTEECIVEDDLVKLKPKVCPTCGQEIKKGV